MYAHWEQSGKMVTIPSSIKEEKVTWELIQKWIDLPRSIGTNNDGHELSMGIGRFGPYIKRVFSDGKIEYRSVPSSVDLAAVDVTVATEILSRERRVFGKRKRGDETQSKKVTAKKRRSS
jgi:DNA topoisomerase-1